MAGSRRARPRTNAAAKRPDSSASRTRRTGRHAAAQAAALPARAASGETPGAPRGPSKDRPRRFRPRGAARRPRPGARGSDGAARARFGPAAMRRCRSATESAKQRGLHRGDEERRVDPSGRRRSRTRAPSTARPPCSVVTAKRPVAACRCAARSRSGIAAAAPSRTVRAKPRPSRRGRPAAASAGSSSTTSISWRIAVAAAIRRPAAIGYPSQPRSRRTRAARQASATTGTRTQLSWATTPEKKIWPGHSARARPAAMRQRKSRIGRQSRKGRSGVSPVTTAVATRAACSVPWGTRRNSTDSSSGKPG